MLPTDSKFMQFVSLVVYLWWSEATPAERMDVISRIWRESSLDAVRAYGALDDTYSDLARRGISVDELVRLFGIDGSVEYE